MTKGVSNLSSLPGASLLSGPGGASQLSSQLSSRLHSLGSLSLARATTAVDELLTNLLLNLPHLEAYVLELTSLVFDPKTLLRQLIAVIILHTGAVTAESLLMGLKWSMSYFSERGREISRLGKEINDLEKTKTFDDFISIAEKIDELKGDDSWRRDPACELYEVSELCVVCFCTLPGAWPTTPHTHAHTHALTHAYTHQQHTQTTLAL